jgi:hypothetical protein
MTLPRPDVSVTVDTQTNGSGTTKVEISRDGKSRSFTSTNPTEAGRTGEIVKEILNDHLTPEWCP